MIDVVRSLVNVYAINPTTNRTAVDLSQMDGERHSFEDFCMVYLPQSQLDCPPELAEPLASRAAAKAAPVAPTAL